MTPSLLIWWLTKWVSDWENLHFFVLIFRLAAINTSKFFFTFWESSSLSLRLLIYHPDMQWRMGMVEGCYRYIFDPQSKGMKRNSNIPNGVMIEVLLVSSGFIGIWKYVASSSMTAKYFFCLIIEKTSYIRSRRYLSGIVTRLYSL